MERYVTAFVFGLCAAPLFFILTLTAIDSINRSDPGQGPSLSTSLLLGVILALVGFIVTGGLALFYGGHGYLRPIQTTTALMLAGWSIAGAIFAWHEPRQLDYSGRQGVLEAEIRVATSLLDTLKPDQVIVPSFLGGSFDQLHTEQIRHEGNFLIIPWETTVNVVYNWSIWVTLRYSQHLYFPMNLPYRPTQSTEWSDWSGPAPHKNSTTPEGISLRYRFKLVPQSVQHQ
ncbi:hypothetical protein [Spirosoma pollinicola]|uniref:Uncharacterized protein n=1 Tax=Spirosoma pollinicola TaxID=2057025 RepID=A0A2K8YUW4_9BACT|nr:hypothetical protein [Spirosoma pollinicola]AUD01411.1 hypothetical protein CWM47_06065 [Spirosoma pollinicola]